MVNLVITRLTDLRSLFKTAEKAQAKWWCCCWQKGGGKATQLDQNTKQGLIETINDEGTVTIEGIIQKLNHVIHSTIVCRWLQKIKYKWKLTRPVPIKTNDHDIKIKSKGHDVTMILALNFHNIISAELVITTSVNSTIFKEFPSKLVTILGRESEFIVVIDNLRFHHSDSEFYDSPLGGKIASKV
ncbi:hypothetical protein RF11_08515 [Thelohanellus kitauei]|uniref:Tc1-like transposase DDE domain-containing protein n=1 Tax=Thelohanellus kitauei TaxID=669202 RepID=A0A0C2J1U8_THEKT|nr:hypothetical protein RF11_08515 [Thelohanellus kitauei]